MRSSMNNTDVITNMQDNALLSTAYIRVCSGVTIRVAPQWHGWVRTGVWGGSQYRLWINIRGRWLDVDALRSNMRMLDNGGRSALVCIGAFDVLVHQGRPGASYSMRTENGYYGHPRGYRKSFERRLYSAARFVAEYILDKKEMLY